MIIFLYGSDNYRSRQKLKEIVEQYSKVHKSGLNLKYLEGNQLEMENLKNETNTSSMFDEKKLIVLKNSLDNFKKEDKFLDFLKSVKNSDDLFIIYEEKEIDERTALVKFLKKNSKFQEFNLFEGAELRKWVKNEIENYKAKIEQDALEKLIEYAGNDLWQMDNEIKKLVNYKKDKKIEKKDIELLVKPKIEPEIFKTIDAIADKNNSNFRRRQALELLHGHIEKGDHPLYLLSMINFQFRNLLVVKELMEKNQPYYSIIKTTGLHPFVVKKSYEQAGKFSLKELKTIYKKIFQLDLNIKTGKIEAGFALDYLVASI